MKKNLLIGAFASLMFSGSLFAADLTGTWQSIDDKTGSPKALIEITKAENGTFTGKIVKVTPRAGYTPKTICVDCPAPYTNKPLVGLEIIKGLQHVDNNNYANGRILDPLAGKMYSLKGRLAANGKRLTLRGYVGISAIGRTQTWIRQ
ncbi:MULTISPECIES: DUF2147 domain-containing protein [Acinetobacter]|jgi:uncharacterized protein (DUF2147 family)|nr:MULTISPECIES: DUF2147 domain-containing protein [Acinetobacter]MBF4521054.1 DUF2147 domain-containing protein [Acinetobacter towneri]MDM1487305.1 DUF2147 domain-containing protein [Acinetobacter towneri]MEB6565991.1 DUF2147 domain-containing protein [Acinetobacter towneri]